MGTLQSPLRGEEAAKKDYLSFIFLMVVIIIINAEAMQSDEFVCHSVSQCSLTQKVMH